MFGFTLFQGKQRKKIERSVAITNKATLPIKRRQREIEAFAAHFGLNRYLCIDDQERLYESGWPNLYAIDRSRGLDEKSSENIASYFIEGEE